MNIFFVTAVYFCFFLDCGAVFEVDKGSLSFMFSKKSWGYFNKRKCSWILKANNSLRTKELLSMKTMIVFHKLDLEDSFECVADFFRFYNYNEDPSVGFKDAGKHCNMMDKQFGLNYTANMAIQFISKHQDNGKGFSLSFVRTMKGNLSAYLLICHALVIYAFIINVHMSKLLFDHQ